MPSKTPSVVLAAAAYAVVSLLISLLATPDATPMAGLVMSAVSCMVLLGVGLLAVGHYTSTHQLTVPGGTGAGMGAAAGALGALIAGLVALALVAAGIVPDPQEALIEQLERQGISDEQIEAMAALAHPVISLTVSMVVAAVVGAIGGAIGASLFKRYGSDREAEMR